MTLLDKGMAEQMPDVLVMTATPIPRTLALTVYGDLDVSIIDELPPGRKPIKTHWKRKAQRDAVYRGIRALVQEGRQVYFVCPLVETSDKLQAKAATEMHEHLQRVRDRGGGPSPARPGGVPGHEAERNPEAPHRQHRRRLPDPDRGA